MSERQRDLSEIYDRQYEWRKKDGWRGWFQDETLAHIFRNLDESVCELAPAGSKLLELGCGAGDQSLYLAAKGYQVTGIELSAEAVIWATEKAMERNLQVDFFVEDARSLRSIPNEQFDVVLDGHCWHFITDKDDRRSFLNTAHRVLKNEGHLIIYTVCNDVGELVGFDPVTRIQSFEDRQVTYIGRDVDLTKEIESNGFTIVKNWIVPKPDNNSADVYISIAKKLS